METDSDSDASHISATPPRNSNPPPIPPSPKSRVRVPLISNPKPRPKSKPRPELKASDQGPPDPPPFPIADLSTLHGLTVRTHRLPDQNHTASFSSLVRSRRPSFDPSDFQKDDNLKANVGGVTENHKDEAPPCDSQPSNRVGSHARMERVHPCWIGSDVHTEQPKCTSNSRPSGRVENRARIERVHPCWIGSDVPSEQLKRPKFSNEGNFVRLNINGHGRKYGYRNGKRRFSASSKAQRYRRRSVGDKFNADAGTKMGPGTLEDDSLDASWDQKRKSDCSSELIEEAVVAAREELSDQNLKNLLKLTHGYDSFREGQLETIKRVVAGESMMLVLPTGAGKSLCYQLPALILPGITLVVSPLVALMVDQLRQLPPAIPGGLLSSTQTSEEASTTLHRLLGGDIKVLFVSPERFLNAEFLSLFGDTLSVSLVVIDEAHCISEWSHNFRPSYLRLRASLLRAKLNAECYLAMTATATTQTLHDIMNALEIPSTNLIQTCQIRKNLQLFMTLSVNRLKDLLMLMKSTPLVGMRSIIIYCKFQAETDLVSKYLCDNNIPAKGYHSGILAKNRIRVQELFCSNKIRVVVATVAFGMGLDKSDVEAVIHYSLPESLEEYIQETGRAGRDGRLSYCHLLLEYSTYYKLRSLMYSDGVDEYSISKLLSHIFSIDIPLAGNICSLVKESTSRKFDMKEEVLLTILTQLEMGDVQYLCLLPQLNVTCTLYFHKTPPALLSIKDVLIATILKKSETKQGHYVFDIPTVANHVGITAIELLNQLQNLKGVIASISHLIERSKLLFVHLYNYLGEITYDVKDPAFCFMIMKKPDDFCSLTTFLTKWLSEVESCKVQKLDAMFNVATFAVKECKRIDGCSDSMHTICIQTKILDYFCRDHNTSHDYCSVDMVKTSRFLSADIKVFLQSNSYAKFTPRAVARIMHGIPSPAFPSSTWSKCHFWGRYMEVDFPIIMKAATMELVNFVRKGEV